jgi:hypothetical protein
MPLGGEDTLILTGEMTGCWLTTFTLTADGVEYIGHIGTNLNSSDPITLQAKRVWLDAVEGRLITCQRAYNPISPTPVYTLTADKVPEFYGAIDRSGKCYTVVLGKSATTIDRNRTVVKLEARPTTNAPRFSLFAQVFDWFFMQPSES